MKDLKSLTRGTSHDVWLRDLLILALVLGIPFLQYLGGTPLIDPDEGRYAEIPREMLERGDLVTPTLNYVKYFEKPPLLYWINAASLKLFGLNEFAARLPSALCGLGTVLATYIIARRLYDRRVALLAAAILGTSAGFVMQSRIILTDMLLTFCLTACLGAFIVGATDRQRRGGSPAWYLFYLFSALAVLAKGLIGIVFPAGIIFFYLVMTSQWKLPGRMRLVPGILIFLAAVTPWFVLVCVRNPEFARFFFIHEHFERFTSSVHGRTKPFWFFLPVLAGTMLPWSFFIPGAVWRGWRDRHHPEGKAGIYLVIWSVLIFAFFSKSGSKLVPYILPIFPPLAIMIAQRFDAAMNGRARDIALPSALLGLVLLLLAAGAAGYAGVTAATGRLAALIPSQAEALRQFAATAPAVPTAGSVLISLLFLVQAIVLLYRPDRFPLRLVTVLCGASWLLSIVIPRAVMGDIARTESPRDLAAALRPLITPETRIVTFGPMQGVSWYLQRRVLVTGIVDELEFGSKQGDQSAWFPDRTAFERLWLSEQPTAAFLKKRDFAAFSPKMSSTSRVVRESGRHMLVVNH